MSPDNQSISLITAQPEDIEQVLVFEKAKLSEAVRDPMELEFALWHSRARRETLEHYFKNGWSFLAFESVVLKEDETPENLVDRNLVGFILAQPLLFFEGLTQSLWVEYIQFSTLQVRDSLCDLAYRLTREKHFQALYMPNSQNLNPALAHLKPQTWVPKTVCINTSKRTVTE